MTNVGRLYLLVHRFYFAEEVWKLVCTIAAPVPAIGLVDSASMQNSLAEIPTKSALLEQI
jgi:hypothetical protein